MCNKYERNLKRFIINTRFISLRNSTLKKYIDLIEGNNLSRFTEPINERDTFHQNGDKRQPIKTDSRLQEPPMDHMKSHRQHVHGACLRWYQHHTRSRIGSGDYRTKFSLYSVNYITIVTIHLQSPWTRRRGRRSLRGGELSSAIDRSSFTFVKNYCRFRRLIFRLKKYSA